MNPAIKKALSPHAIMIAMGGACLLYVAAIILSLVYGGKTLDALEDKMAAQNIVFDKPASHVTADVQHEKEMQKATKEHVDLSDKIGGSTSPLPPAPYEGLTDKTQFGALPVIGKNKLKPFDAYKKPYDYNITKPAIAIAVTGIGFSEALYQGIYKKLSPKASLILSPYVDAVHDIQKEARSMGYETWLEMPFENKRFPYADPGSKGILVSSGLKFNQDNYRSVLASTAGYAGIAGYTDDAFKDAKTMLGGILTDAFGRGLGFFEMNSGKDSMSLKIAINNRAPHVTASVPLKTETVSMRFKTLKKKAIREKQAIGVIEISPAMLDDFQQEILKAQEEGFEIVPLSALVDKF